MTAPRARFTTNRRVVTIWGGVAVAGVLLGQSGLVAADTDGDVFFPVTTTPMPADVAYDQLRTASLHTNLFPQSSGDLAIAEIAVPDGAYAQPPLGAFAITDTAVGASTDDAIAGYVVFADPDDMERAIASNGIGQAGNEPLNLLDHHGTQQFNDGGRSMLVLTVGSVLVFAMASTQNVSGSPPARPGPYLVHCSAAPVLARLAGALYHLEALALAAGAALATPTP